VLPGRGDPERVRASAYLSSRLSGARARMTSMPMHLHLSSWLSSHPLTCLCQPVEKRDVIVTCASHE